MAKPDVEEGTRACIALKTDRLTVYLNRPAALSLIRRLQLMYESDPTGHYELHLTADFDQDSVLNPEQEPQRVWTLVDTALAAHIVQPGPVRLNGEDGWYSPFDLNLMMATDNDLDELAAHRASGLLPALHKVE